MVPTCTQKDLIHDPKMIQNWSQKHPKIHFKSIKKSIKKSMQFCIGTNAKFYRTMGPRWRPRGVPKATKNINLEVPSGVFFKPSYTSSSIAIKTQSPPSRDSHNTSRGTPIWWELRCLGPRQKIPLAVGAGPSIPSNLIGMWPPCDILPH